MQRQVLAIQSIEYSQRFRGGIIRAVCNIYDIRQLLTKQELALIVDYLSILSPMFDIIFKKYSRALPDEIWEASRVLGLNSENVPKPNRGKTKSSKQEAVIDEESDHAELEAVQSIGRSDYLLYGTVYSRH